MSLIRGLSNMASSKLKIQLFYDVVSPFSWVAFEVLCQYRKPWNMELEFCPFFLSGIMKGSDNKPPGVVPAKAVYMTKDIRRLAEFYQMPLRFPTDVAEVMFVKGSLKSQRLLTATKLSSPAHVEELSRQLWSRIWSRDEDITEVESLREACSKAGLSQDQAEDLIGQTETSTVKEELKKTTQIALDNGAFGSPFMLVHTKDGRKEEFFGGDRFEVMAHMIGEKWEGPLPQQKAHL